MLRWKLSVRSDSENDELFIGNVFQELDSMMESIFKKHDGSVRRNDCHPIIDIWPMTERVISKLHDGIYRRLRSTPTTASPYFCQFTREVSEEVFGVISNRIIDHNSFGHTTTTTAARVTIVITDKRKAIYLFNRMNDEGVKVEKNKLLKKNFPDNCFAEVIISKEQPMTLKFSKNKEVLSITFYYGYWNNFGIPQH
jgi:hypothetical protein